jgi:hypothetical protein
LAAVDAPAPSEQPAASDSQPPSAGEPAPGAEPGPSAAEPAPDAGAEAAKSPMAATPSTPAADSMASSGMATPPPPTAAANAAEAGGAMVGEPAPGPSWPADCEQHYSLTSNAGTPGSKYVVPAGQEIHPQILFDAPWTSDVQAVAFRPITDNRRVLHHWILYGSDGSFITGWAPGADDTHNALPADVGMYIPTAGKLRLDMHYNNLPGTVDQLDGSGVEICAISTPQKFRKNTAAIVGLIGNPTVPARSRVDNVTKCTVDTKTGTATLIAESPHMHTLGVHAKLELTQNGVTRVLHDAPFNFDQQHSTPLDPAVIVKTGDTLTVTCSFQNDTNRVVTFGENTGDEMCFNFVAAYPKGGFSCRLNWFGF